jgi:hypothetical protein
MYMLHWFNYSLSNYHEGSVCGELDSLFIVYWYLRRAPEEWGFRLVDPRGHEVSFDGASIPWFNERLKPEAWRWNEAE